MSSYKLLRNIPSILLILGGQVDFQHLKWHVFLHTRHNVAVSSKI